MDRLCGAQADPHRGLLGHGIGPIIAQETQRVLEHVLADEVRSGRVAFRTIEGFDH
jgi:hypothetical protein